MIFDTDIVLAVLLLVASTFLIKLLLFYYIKKQTAMKTPRKHAELIKKWADDDKMKIECRLHDGSEWGWTSAPIWDENCQYREADPFRELKEAHAAGKTIEIMVDGRWSTIFEPSFSEKVSDYRIKPEPKYVPYTLSDSESLLGKSIKRKDGSQVLLMTGFSSVGFLSPNGVITFSNLLEEWVYTENGSPCGKISS